MKGMQEKILSAYLNVFYMQTAASLCVCVMRALRPSSELAQQSSHLAAGLSVNHIRLIDVQPGEHTMTMKPQLDTFLTVHFTHRQRHTQAETEGGLR